MKALPVSVIAIVCVLGGAQRRLPSATPRQSSGEATQALQQMGAIVESLSGTWSVTWSKVEGTNQERVTGHGEEVWKLAPGGVPFIEENRSTVNGKPAEDYAAMWWDGKAQDVRGIWCNAAINDEGCSGFTVTLEGDDIVLTGEWEQRGKRWAWREVFSISRQAGLTQRLYIGEPGKELKLVEILRGTKR